MHTNLCILKEISVKIKIGKKEEETNCCQIKYLSDNTNLLRLYLADFDLEINR